MGGVCFGILYFIFLAQNLVIKQCEQQKKCKVLLGSQKKSSVVSGAKRSGSLKRDGTIGRGGVGVTEP